MMVKNLPSDISSGKVQMLISFTMNDNGHCPFSSPAPKHTHEAPSFFPLYPRNELANKVRFLVGRNGVRGKKTRTIVFCYWWWGSYFGRRRWAYGRTDVPWEIVLHGPEWFCKNIPTRPGCSRIEPSIREAERPALKPSHLKQMGT